MIQCRPSSSHIWSKCYGYPRMIAVCESEGDAPSDPAREGTCAAWVAEMVLTGQAENCHALIGQAHANGWLVDADMANFIQNYVDLLTERYGANNIVTERHVQLSEHISGTPDAWAIVDGVLHVDDLKYGHMIVEPWDNTQVSIYAGAIAKLSPVPITRVVIGIYQPRAYHPLGHYRTWEPSIEELSEKLAGLIYASEQAQSPEAMCTSGEHCRHCDAAHRCAAVAFEAYRAVSFMRNDAQREMTDSELSAELAFLELADAVLSARKTAVRSDARSRIRSGRLIEGWVLESGLGDRRWKVDKDVIQAVTGIDPTSDKMVTPAELERRGASKKLVAALVERPDTAPKLTRYSQRVVASKFGGGV